MLGLRIAIRTIVYASLASAGAAVLYGAYGFLKARGAHLSPEAIIWVLVVAVTVFPVALGSSIVATLMERSSIPAKPIVVLIVLATVPCISAVIFIGYMRAAAPAINSSSGWWLPVLASVAAIGLALLKPKMPFRQ